MEKSSIRYLGEKTPTWKTRLAQVSQLASDRLDLLDRIRRVAKSRCLRDSDKLVAIQQILKGY